jgi:hypothetical protein
VVVHPVHHEATGKELKGEKARRIREREAEPFRSNWERIESQRVQDFISDQWCPEATGKELKVSLTKTSRPSLRV